MRAQYNPVLVRSKMLHEAVAWIPLLLVALLGAVGVSVKYGTAGTIEQQTHK